MNKFVICIDNSPNPASLILGKVYSALPDSEAETHNMLRVIDEDRSEPVVIFMMRQCLPRLSYLK